MNKSRYYSRPRFIYGSEFDRRLSGAPWEETQEAKKFGSPHTMICPTCGGSSFIPDECPRCHGGGRDPFYIFEKCLKCKGTRAIQVSCPNPNCQGGYIVVRY